MLEMINFVFPISVSMASSSRWGSYSDSADDGCLEKVTDLWMKMGSSRTPASRSTPQFTNCGVILDAGVLGFWCEL